MKILQLCKKFPYPLKDGEIIAVNTLAKSLKQLGANVTLLTMNTSKHPVAESEISDNFRSIYQAIHSVEVYNNITAFGAFKNLFEKESYHVTRFISEDYKLKLIEILRGSSFDVIQLETIFLTPYVPIIREFAPESIIALRAHNVEHEIWKRVADETKFQPKKQYLNLLNEKLKRFELENIQKCDILLPITDRDLSIYRSLGYQGLALSTPVGLNGSDYLPDEKSFKKPLSIGFIGSLDWMPNQKGLQWFLENVWTIYKASENSTSKVELHIAGRNAPDWLKKMSHKDVHFHGEVENAKDFMNQHALQIVPLFSGGGIRVKILEAMMLGRVVLTTSMGLEGIEAKDGVEILVANTAEEFKSKIEFCLKNQKILSVIGQNGRKLIETKYDNLSVATKVLAQYNKMSKLQVKINIKS